jgi:hypothetical protein
LKHQKGFFFFQNENNHSESIASNTKSPTGGIFHQNSSRAKLNFDLISNYLRLQSQFTKVQKN